MAASTNVDFPDLISIQGSGATLVCEGTKNLNYQYADAAQYNSAFTWTITGDPIIKGINNMIAARSFVRDTDNEIFEFQTPFIQEPLPASGDNYTIEFSATGGEFGDTDDLNTSSSTFSFTGSITDANAKFSKILYYPPSGITGGTSYTMTYTQKKAGVTQLTKTVALNNTNNTVDNQVRYLYFESNSTYTPNRTLELYKTFHFLVVGGGGGGGGHNLQAAGGGGGGGEVKYSIHEGLTNGVTFASSGPLTVTIGSAGSAGASDNVNGTAGTGGGNGGSTSLTYGVGSGPGQTGTTYTAQGGDGGSISDGGDEGGGRYTGANGFVFGLRTHGGGGAGAGDLWYNSTFGVSGQPINPSSSSPSQGVFSAPGFNHSNITGWGDDFLYAQGGCGTGSNGSGFLPTGDKANYNGVANGWYFHPVNGNLIISPETMYQRGQGGGGGCNIHPGAYVGASRPATDGQAGVVAIKYF